MIRRTKKRIGAWRNHCNDRVNGPCVCVCKAMAQRPKSFGPKKKKGKKKSTRSEYSVQYIGCGEKFPFQNFKNKNKNKQVAIVWAILSMIVVRAPGRTAYKGLLTSA